VTLQRPLGQNLLLVQPFCEGAHSAQWCQVLRRMILSTALVQRSLVKRLQRFLDFSHTLCTLSARVQAGCFNTFFQSCYRLFYFFFILTFFVFQRVDDSQIEPRCLSIALRPTLSYDLVLIQRGLQITQTMIDTTKNEMP